MGSNFDKLDARLGVASYLRTKNDVNIFRDNWQNKRHFWQTDLLKILQYFA